MAPSKKVTVPVALPPKASWIVAESVTDWAKLDGLGLEVAVVVVVAPLTTWLNAAEVLPERLALPA